MPKQCILCTKPQKGALWNYRPGNGFVNPNTSQFLLMKDVGLYPVCEDHMMVISGETSGVYTTVPYGCSN